MSEFKRQKCNRSSVQDIADKYDLSLKEACEYIDVLDTHNALRSIDDPSVRFVLEMIIKRFGIDKVHSNITRMNRIMK